MKLWRNARMQEYCKPFSVTRARRNFSSEQLKRSNTNPTLQVSEIFKSVQGEGPFTGRPSIFLRLGVCNLSCVWCDTPYTWLFTDERLQKIRTRVEASSAPDTPIPNVYKKKDELTHRAADDVIHDVLNLADSSVQNVVITGGEPLLHKKPLLQVVDTFIQHGFSIEFETNGTISPAGLPSQVHLNVSPKLSNSLQPHHMRVNIDNLKTCLQFPSSVLKFVIDNRADIDEALDIVKSVNLDAQRVYLMPQGSVSFLQHLPAYFSSSIRSACNHGLGAGLVFTILITDAVVERVRLDGFVQLKQNSELIGKKGRWLVETCLQYGFQYSHRLHVELWGTKRGV